MVALEVQSGKRRRFDAARAACEHYLRVHGASAHEAGRALLGWVKEQARQAVVDGSAAAVLDRLRAAAPPTPG